MLDPVDPVDVAAHRDRRLALHGEVRPLEVVARAGATEVLCYGTAVVIEPVK